MTAMAAAMGAGGGGIPGVGPDDFGLLSTPKGLFLFHEDPDLDAMECLVVRRDGLWASLPEGREKLLGLVAGDVCARLAATASKLGRVLVLRPSAKIGGEAPVWIDHGRKASPKQGVRP